jgi:hypothetical protein
MAFILFILAFIIVGELIYIRCITQSFCFFVVLVDLSLMIDSHVSQVMLKISRDWNSRIQVLIEILIYSCPSLTQ